MQSADEPRRDAVAGLGWDPGNPHLHAAGITEQLREYERAAGLIA